jgi:signal transduction histidine kinase
VGGRIEVTFETGGDSCRLSLFNTGDGVPEAKLNRMFEQFYRLEKSRSPRHGGAGLGLTIVKRIIERHGGSVSMHREAGAGARVEIHLPLRQSIR